MLVFPPLGVTELVTTTDGDPALVSDTVLQRALTLCASRRAMLVVDAPAAWETVQDAVTGIGAFALSGESAKNAALYFPYLRVTDPDVTKLGRKIDMPPAGAVAGVYARTDTQRGVWKAPAGTDASLAGVPELSLKLSDLENGRLNPLGVNCLRSLPIMGRVVWGARTPVPRHAVGRLRAERRAALGADTPERRRLHAEPLPPGRLPGLLGQGGLLREVR